jgi:formylmethanofuran dehydrogenase subunit E
MKKAQILVPAGLVLIILLAVAAKRYLKSSPATSGPQKVTVEATEGNNPWNRGTAPEDPWKAIEQMHGHVGPWNVLGWRIGQKALADFNTHWGRHDLDITIYIPLATPYSCMADGLVIGTGNSIGRLDIRLAQVPKMEMICVEISKKGSDAERIIYKPKIDYLEKILTAPPDDIHALSHECFELEDKALFDEERIK